MIKGKHLRSSVGGAIGVACFLLSNPLHAAITAGTYPLTVVNTGLITNEDMSSGTTLVAGPIEDNTSSTAADIGFEFWFDGARYTQFSVSTNGVLRLGSTPISAAITNSLTSVADSPKIAIYWDDICTSHDGKLHYKVFGTAPNRKLVIEWSRVATNKSQVGGCGANDPSFFRMRLFETTGVIEFVYNTTNANPGGYSIGLQSGTSTNFASITTAGDTVSYTTANDTQTDAITGRRYTFTPNTPAAPTNLGFSNGTPTSLTLNWTDNATNEFGYVVSQSTDNVNFTIVAQTPANAVSQTINGLTPATTYYYRLYAVSEGAVSASISGNQATVSPNLKSCVPAGGLWSSPATWSPAVVPTVNDNVTIIDGATVNIDTAAAAYVVNVGTGSGSPAVLQFEQTTARTLTVDSNVTVASNGTLQSNPSGTQTGHLLKVGGNLTNNGILDFQTNSISGPAGANLEFTGASNNTFDGNGTKTSIRTLKVNKGSSTANVLTLQPANFLIGGSNVEGSWMSFLTLTAGTLHIAGTFPMSSHLFTSPVYTIPTGTGVWLDNPNFTVVGQSGSPTLNGLLRVSQGTFNIGTGASQSLAANANSFVTVEGGTLNVTGRLTMNPSVTYTQNGGTVNVSTLGNSASNASSFFLAGGAAFNMSGGNINIVQGNNAGVNPTDYRNDADTDITGGTLNLGTAATSFGLYRIRGTTPSLVIDNFANNKTVTLLASLHILGDFTNESGCQFILNGFLCDMQGGTLTNDGIIIGSTANSRLSFAGSVAQTYGGSGNLGSLSIFELNNPSGLTMSSTNQLGTLRINLIEGGVTNSNKLALGTGGSSGGTIQIGNTTTATTPVQFDVAPTFNLGTGGQVIQYLRLNGPWVTGNEINPTRSLLSVTMDNDALLNDEVDISGGDITVTSSGVALTLTDGRVVTGNNSLILSSPTATVTRTNGIVEGNLAKNYSAAGSKDFEIGTISGYSPVTINATSGTFPATITAGVKRARHPNYQSINTIKRYWTLTAPANVPAALTFTYFGSDVFTRNETNFKIVKYNGAFSLPASTVNTSANTVSVAAAAAPISGDWFIIGEADTDLDGMTDAYETANGFNINNAADAGLDFDGDGMTNLQESVAGTNPKNAQDNLHITSIVKDGTGVTVYCSAIDFKSYRLDYKNALTDPTWTFLRFSNPHTGLTSAPLPDVTIGNGLRRFYRVSLMADDQL